MGRCASQEGYQATGMAPLVSTLVYVSKGDLQKPIVRSRFVTKEVADIRSDEFFAATPPLGLEDAPLARRILAHHGSWRPEPPDGGRPQGSSTRRAREEYFLAASC